MSPNALQKSIDHARKEMLKAAKELAFVEAAQWRDELLKLEEQLNKSSEGKGAK